LAGTVNDMERSVLSQEVAIELVPIELISGYLRNLEDAIMLLLWVPKPFRRVVLLLEQLK